MRRVRWAGTLPLAAALAASLPQLAQSPPAPQSAAPESGPIAVVSLDNKNPERGAKVTGAIEVSQGKAIIAASGAVTSGAETTEVILPHRGVLRVCASTTVKLAADSSVPAGEVPGLLIAIDHGAVEASFATGRNSDILLTPDFRILIGGPGAAEVKVRLGQHGDTCVDNAVAPSDLPALKGAPAPTSPEGQNAGAPSDRSSPLGQNAGVNAAYVLVSSVFEGGAYRVQAGQRVMFEHGSLHEVVDREREPCGCPPSAPKGNEFPLAQSEGLAPTPAPASSEVDNGGGAARPLEPLVYTSQDHAPQPPAEAKPPAGSGSNPPAKPAEAKRKPGLFARVGRFFRRIFGAE